MYSEIGFLFNKSLSLSNSDNTGNIYNREIKIQSKKDTTTTQGQETNADKLFPDRKNLTTTSNSYLSNNDTTTYDSGVLVYKNSSEYVGTTGIKNYLKSSVYRYDESNEDPYISLINYFGDWKSKAMKLRAADFAYLKDLGVYPINRLWILRRFPDNCIVPNNLLSWGNSVSAISTVVGWMKDKEDNPMFSLSFSEVWTDQRDMIDKVFSEILKSEFGLKLPSMMSVPGWSQGILFGMLKAMGLSDSFDSKNVPTGNPNVLRTAKMREINSQGLKTNLELSLETEYEQKYINGIDPGLAMLDIISNLLKMGTSDQKFILGNSPQLIQLIGTVNSSSQKVEAWLEFIKSMIKAFVTGVTNFIDEISSSSSNVTTTTSSNSENNVSLTTSIAEKGVIEQMGSFVMGLSDTILTGTVSKYRWPLKGSIGLMSGINTTPWHLTVGNPYSPIINIGNIVVNDVRIKPSNDLGFNDMPARLDVSIQIELGRPLGKQEIEKMFNNGYKRVYSSKNLSSITDSYEPNSDITSSSIPASMKNASLTNSYLNSQGLNVYPIPTIPDNFSNIP